MQCAEILNIADSFVEAAKKDMDHHSTQRVKAMLENTWLSHCCHWQFFLAVTASGFNIIFVVPQSLAQSCDNNIVNWGTLVQRALST